MCLARSSAMFILFHGSSPGVLFASFYSPEVLCGTLVSLGSPEIHWGNLSSGRLCNNLCDLYYNYFIHRFSLEYQ